MSEPNEAHKIETMQEQRWIQPLQISRSTMKTSHKKMQTTPQKKCTSTGDHNKKFPEKAGNKTKQKQNQCQAIRHEFEPIDPTMLKNPLDARWRLLPILQWVG